MGNVLGFRTAADRQAMIAAQREEALKQQALQVLATTVSGQTFEVKVLPSDTVRYLKSCLAEPSGVPAHQQRLLSDTRVLKDTELLDAVAVPDRPLELTLVIGPPVPKWAFELGFDGDHPSLLRMYFQQHSSSERREDWLEDDAQCWDKLEKSMQANAERLAALQGWNHEVKLFMQDEPMHIIHASPGQEVNLRADVRIQNNQADSCIQQLVLAMDTTIVGELYNGVPGRARQSSSRVRFSAPSAAGVHMLWRKNDLQYGMADARRNFENSVRKPMPEDWYPDKFVGWLIVDSSNGSST